METKLYSRLILLVAFLFFTVKVLGMRFDDITNSPYTLLNKSVKVSQLTAMQYKVTQHNSTENPYDNAYWNNKKPGIYVDVVSGEPLFSSTDKYDSNTGWPSFKKPLDVQYIVTRPDPWLFLVPRIEVRSKYANSHLGEIFADGPPPSGKRYSINSAALRFVPVAELKKDGYGKYLYLFDNSPHIISNASHAGKKRF